LLCDTTKENRRTEKFLPGRRVGIRRRWVDIRKRCRRVNLLPSLFFLSQNTVPIL
jgi:hypothetical protein